MGSPPPGQVHPGEGGPQLGPLCSAAQRWGWLPPPLALPTGSPRAGRVSQQVSRNPARPLAAAGAGLSKPLSHAVGWGVALEPAHLLRTGRAQTSSGRDGEVQGWPPNVGRQVSGRRIWLPGGGGGGAAPTHRAGHQGARLRGPVRDREDSAPLPARRRRRPPPGAGGLRGKAAGRSRALLAVPPAGAEGRESRSAQTHARGLATTPVRWPRRVGPHWACGSPGGRLQDQATRHAGRGMSPGATTTVPEVRPSKQRPGLCCCSRDTARLPRDPLSSGSKSTRRPPARPPPPRCQELHPGPWPCAAATANGKGPAHRTGVTHRAREHVRACHSELISEAQPGRTGWALPQGNQMLLASCGHSGSSFLN